MSVVGYVFTLLALATSFWANTLNLRDIVGEQTGWSRHISWLAASLPCLLLAFFGLSSFVGFTRFASVIQVVTGLGILSRAAESAAPRSSECSAHCRSRSWSGFQPCSPPSARCCP